MTVILTNSTHSAEALLRASKHWQARQHAEAKEPLQKTPTACTIAISREAGALGSSIGQEVATRLGWQLYDQELLNRIGEEMGLRASLLQSIDEQGKNWVRDLFEGFRGHVRPAEHRFVQRLIEMIGSLARHGECVIVGRGSALVLPAETTLRVRLIAPRPFRVATIQQAKGLSPEEAAHWVDTTDRERAAFSKDFFHKDATDPALYDLLPNVSRFTVNQCAGMIIEALRHLEENRRQS